MAYLKNVTKVNIPAVPVRHDTPATHAIPTIHNVQKVGDVGMKISHLLWSETQFAHVRIIPLNYNSNLTFPSPFHHKYPPKC